MKKFYTKRSVVRTVVSSVIHVTETASQEETTERRAREMDASSSVTRLDVIAMIAMLSRQQTVQLPLSQMTCCRLEIVFFSFLAFSKTKVVKQSNNSHLIIWHGKT